MIAGNWIYYEILIFLSEDFPLYVIFLSEYDNLVLYVLLLFSRGDRSYCRMFNYCGNGGRCLSLDSQVI